MSKTVGIDLGTANTVIHLKGSGIVLREPSVVVTDLSRKKVLAVGDEAKRMLGRTPGGITAQFPMKNGVVADYDLAVRLLQPFLKKINAIGIISKPVAVVTIPCAITEVHRRAVEDVMYGLGARKVGLIPQPLAAAVGAGLDVCGTRGSMIVNLGGGTTEAAVISLKGIVQFSSEMTGGSSMDAAIVDYLREEHQILIGASMAENLKKTIGSVHPSTDRGETEIRGINLRTGLPVVTSVTSAQIRRALERPVDRIVDIIRRTLECTPPELSADIFDYGILLTGGGALLGGLQQAISDRIHVRVTIAKKPLDSAAAGIGRIIDRGMEGLVDFRGR